MVGAGHAFGVVVLALLGQLLRARVDVEAWSATAELGVGVLLVVLGVWTLWRTRALVIHDHPHGDEHGHLHVHLGDATVGTPDHAQAPHGHRHSAFGFGVLHGVAGTGHLLGVLPTLALSPEAAAVYVAGYLTSAVLVMGGVGALAGRTRPRHVPWALRLSGVAAVVVGVAWMTVV